MTYADEDFVKAVQSFTWTFAKTMPENPHEYIVRGKTADNDTYFAMFRTIETRGKWVTWKGAPYQCLYPSDGYRYWKMTDNIEESIIINRAQEGARIPKSVKLEIGGFLQGHITYKLTFTSKGATLNCEAHLHEEPLDSQRFSEEEAVQLKERFSAIHTDYWSEDYFDPNVLDGEQWSLAVRYTDGSILEHSGSNAYPENWNELLEFFGIEQDAD